MRLNFLAPLQVFARPKYQLALFFVSYFTAKILHLGSHASSLPILLYVLYFPTFMLQDILLLVVSKAILFTQHGGQTSNIKKVIGGLLALFTAACSAAQIAFFAETGGEIQWMAATRVLGGSAGLRLMLSGLPAVGLTFLVLCGISFIITPTFYDAVDTLLQRLSASFQHAYGLVRNTLKVDEAQVPLISLEESRSASPVEPDSFSDIPKAPQPPTSTRSAIAISFTALISIAVVLILQLVRPKTQPYGHMSGSLPITLIEAVLFQPINSEFCLPYPAERAIFPFESFHAFFNSTQSQNWLPQSPSCTKDNGPGPPWRELPEDITARTSTPMSAIPDFDSGPPQNSGDDHPGSYSPRCDPLKLSNLEAVIMENLKTSLKTKKPKIKNILLISLESTRKDMFPFKKDSHAYRTIASTYGSSNATFDLDAKLASLTETAAFLTGESTGFEAEHQTTEEKPWKSAFKHGMGGVNVKGAVTQGAYTFKSLVSSHCGVEPLPVDFTEETRGRIYQACLPQIMEKLYSSSSNGTDGANKGGHEAREASETDYRAQEWTSTFIQSVTDQFDNQDVLNERMGFNHTITESYISDERSKYYPPKQPWVNYFGYAEPESFGYFRDLFVDSMKEGKRAFVSHITSTSHHPWATPKDWPGKKAYLNQQHWRPNDPFEDYLNTIKYQDDWISDIFQMLHDVGALQETLVVMAGDHGLAFSSVDGSVSAVNNGHISNFAIPLLFVHPDLPRIQVNASTTPTSIIPTILDLLIETDSLTTDAAATARELLPHYQGNSLIRDLDFTVLTADGSPGPAFFQPFHFSAINPGGSVFAISDASTPFRLILPLCSASPLRFTNRATDPDEKEPVVAWTMKDLASIVKVKHGERAKDWAMLAEELGRWWVWNQRSKWGYWLVARSTGRGAAERSGIGQIKHKHWWET